MELTTDVYLRGTAWNKAIEDLSPIFKTRTHYMLYILAMTIGIMYDQRIEKPIEANEDPKSVPRNVLRNNDNGKLDFKQQYYQQLLSNLQKRNVLIWPLETKRSLRK